MRCPEQGTTEIDRGTVVLAIAGVCKVGFWRCGGVWFGSGTGVRWCLACKSSLPRSSYPERRQGLQQIASQTSAWPMALTSREVGTGSVACMVRGNAPISG